MILRIRIQLLFFLLLFLNQSVFSQKNSEDYFSLGEKNKYDNTQKAIDYYLKAIELDSSCYKCYYGIAWIKYSDDTTGVFTDLFKAISINPNCDKCNQLMGDYFLNMALDYKSARQYYYQSLRSYKFTFDNYADMEYYVQQIGLSYFLELEEDDNARKIDREKRLALWDSLIAKNPFTNYYEDRANIKSDELIHDYKGALADYMTVLEKQKYHSSNLLSSIADCHNKLKDYFQAIQYYNQAIESRKTEGKYDLDNDLKNLYYYRANSKMKLDDYRGAVEDFKLAIAHHSSPKYTSTKKIVYTFYFIGIIPMYNSLGHARLLLHDYQNALQDLNKCLSIIATQGKEQDAEAYLADTYYLLGFAKINLNNKEGACKAWSKAGEMGNKDAYDAIKENCK